MSPITTHILDLESGLPAAGVHVQLDREENGAWTQIASGLTDGDGRIKDLLKPGSLSPGYFRLTFDVAAYFDGRKKPTFYQRVPVEFKIEAIDRHFHVPLLISPFGYSTYRGS